MFLFKRKSGKKEVYYLYYADPETNKRRSVSTGANYKPEALKFLSEFKHKLNLKICETLKVIDVKDLKKEVMKYVSNNMEYSTSKICNRVFNDILRIIGNKPIKLISTNDIETYKETRIKEVKPATVNIDLNTMKAIFNIAINFEWINFNPVKRIKKLSIPEKENLSFTDEQLKLIIAKIQDKNIKGFILFALYTGCRLNEIVNLQWNDINMKDRIITIRNKPNFKTKTGKIRYIPISDNLERVLSELLNAEAGIIKYFNPANYIFQNRSGYKFTKNYITKYFKSILRKLYFEEKYHFHCLRHTFITSLIKNGVSINYVKEIAGHSEITTTMNYIHISTNDLREAVNKINIPL